MLVLGVDPGTRHLGWGVIESVGSRLRHVAHGVIDTDERTSLAERLVVIDDQLRAVIAAHAPIEAGIESIFFAKDASAAAKLGHARGVALLALQRAGVRTFEYAPALVKRAVTGGGRAEKSQVALMVRAMLRLVELPRSDAADALAIAMTHVQSAPMRRIAEAGRVAALARGR